VGVLPRPATRAEAHGSCGDSLELYLRVEDDLVTAARFIPHGCIHTVACGSVLTTLVQGASLDQAFQITPERVDQALGGLPRAHRHCAVVAVTALRRALRDHYRDRAQPWKRLYQRP
jgi:NifU-like protein involved in Fe-S cluster formation